MKREWNVEAGSIAWLSEEWMGMKIGVSPDENSQGSLRNMRPLAMPHEPMDTSKGERG